MLSNNTMIPSVQVGSGIPLQSTTMAQSVYPQQNMAQMQTSLAPVQSAIQPNMAPVQSGSILQIPPGSIVPVQAGNSVVYVPTQPIATQSVQTSVQPQIQYQTQSVQVPVETQYVQPEPIVESQFDATANLQMAPEYGSTTTPQLRTLQPRVVRNTLPPQYKQVMLPAKIVTTRLPPIGPPPTPELNLQLPPPPVKQVQSVVVPQPAQQVQSVMVPVQVPQYQTTSVPVTTYQTASIPQLSTPKYGTTSVIAQY